MAVVCRYYFYHLFVILQDFVIVWQNTPCTVCHHAIHRFPHWCCWTVLPDGVLQHNFSQRWCHFTCLYAWTSEGIYPGRPLVDSFKCFYALMDTFKSFLKIWVIWSVSRPFQSSETLQNLTRKMKYLTDQFRLCLCFCIRLKTVWKCRLISFH